MTSSTDMATRTLRQADMAALNTVLQGQRAEALDVVVPASSIVMEGTTIRFDDPVLSDTGVTDIRGVYSPTSVADEGFSEKLEIDLRYLRKCKYKAPGLYQDNLQTWLDRDDRNFLLRLFKANDLDQGVLRAVLSDRYRVIDNLDVALAVLSGIRDAGIENPVIDADLTERRMIVRVAVPQIAVYAADFLKGYRNPFDGTDAGRGWTPDAIRRAALAEGHDVQDKVVFAGFVFSNSEVGEGAFNITPRIIIGPCTNGLQLQAEVQSKPHLGAKLDNGVIRWSQETIQKNLALITSQTKDAVTTFLDKDYVTRQVELLHEQGNTKLKQPQGVITAVSKKFGFTEAQANEIMGHFIRGGQTTALGVAQAFTSVSQGIVDGDVAWEMERKAVPAIKAAIEADKALVKV